ncbi:uncharacterized protein LOC105426586, partial [Pogonomyrmex barbatus]|uniref:Cell division cycle protein 27 homolog n=1 Tax=Pogonomyrmex barbatus TaxID=144034 RepID=A0A6I9W4B7_9HYME
NIIDPKDFNDIESGALYGCKSSIWSCLHDFGIEEAIDTAKRAIKMNQDCALWHFILGKNLRRKRRATNVSSDVSDSEKNHFEIAHAISKNQMFEVYYLQMCMESFKKFIRSRDYVIKKNANEREVISKAKKMLNTNPTDHKVLLKLALIFLRTRISDERYSAKKCLDAVNKIVPNNTTYLHYTAMLYEQSGDYKEAIKYFKKAAECNNLVAELSYIQYGWETGQLEPLPHLLRMLKKYDQSIKSRQIAMLLAIAITYYSLHEDIPNAAEYFLKALEIDPVHKKFQVYYKFLDFNTLNISSFLNNNFCPLLEKKYPAHTETCKKIKNLLNVKDITDLVEEMCGLSVEKKKF